MELLPVRTSVSKYDLCLCVHAFLPKAFFVTSRNLKHFDTLILVHDCYKHTKFLEKKNVRLIQMKKVNRKS